MTAHGPDYSTFHKAVSGSNELTPQYFNQGLAFMFESNFMLKVSQKALQVTGHYDLSYPKLQQDYQECWKPLPKIFTTSLEVKPIMPWNK